MNSGQTRALNRLARDTFRYFWDLANPRSGFVPDSTKEGYPSSIAATGLGLACLVVAAERGWISRAQATERARTTLRAFWYGPEGVALDAIGHRGFFYHFLDMNAGHRSGNSELSTIDTTWLIAGALTCGAYFDRHDRVERDIRTLADALYRRVDWRWALAGGDSITHGWTPERGFLRFRWRGYNEALLLYVLALGSPTFPIPAGAYRAWSSTYKWRKLYGEEFLYGGPLFVHQLSHLWVDFRGIQDAFMRARGSDYFENSRRATRVQQRYAIRNPRGYRGYGEYVWGISASDGPGPSTLRVDGRTRRFWDYRARGVPWGPDDGTLTPWAVVGSLPFEPQLVVNTLEEIDRRFPEMISEMGYKCSFNPTFVDGSTRGKGWISAGHYGIDQGPVVLMIENTRSDLIWRLMRRCPYVVRGLLRAGFRGGWLDS